MRKTTIIKLEDIKLKRGVLVQGLPGLGFAGKIAVDYIISELKLKKVAELYSPHFMLPHGSAGVYITQEALLRLPHYEFYLFKGENRDVLFLAGDVQPVSWGQYEVADILLDFFKEIGGEEVVIVCGTTAGERERTKTGIPPIFIVADSKTTKQELLQMGFKPSIGGTITGAAGVLPALAYKKGLKSYVLMASTQSAEPDPEAGRELVKALNRLFNLNVSLENIENIITELKKREEELEKIRETWTKKEGKPPQYYV